jgi:hypothetical protein
VRTPQLATRSIRILVVPVLLAGVAAAPAAPAVAARPPTGHAGPGVATAGTDPSWALQSTPNPPGGVGISLDGVSCTSATACTAAGSYGNRSGAGVTLAERWNGTKWAIQPTPNPSGASGSFLFGVSCRSAKACTAADGYTARSSGIGLTLAERWNGTKWAIQPTPSASAASGSGLFGVSCPSTTACTAVGYYVNDFGDDLTLAEHWNGKKWAIQPTRNPSGVESILDGVSCTSATACTAIGFYANSSGVEVTLAEHWNGTKWAIQPTPNPSGSQDSNLYGVSCTSAKACTAAGYYYSRSDSDLTLAERWNGTKWAIQSTPNRSGNGIPNGYLEGVSCPSTTACTAAGYYFNSSGQVTLAERWNGTKWAIQSTPNPSGSQGSELLGVSCTSATACTAAGDYINSSDVYVTLAERYS